MRRPTNMVARNIQLGFFFTIFALTAILAFFILEPYINILILAITFAVIFYPLYKKITGKKSSNFNNALAAILTIVVIFIIVLLPLTFLGLQVFNEAQGVYKDLQEASENETSILVNIPDSQNPTIAKIQTKLRASLTEFGDDPSQLVDQGLNWVKENVAPFFRSLAGAILGFFLWLIALFFFLKDGKRIQKLIVTASPLNDKYDNEIINRLDRAVKSVIGGTLVVALIQGILAAIGFALFGVPLPFIWGSLAVLAALIPTIGTALITLPAVAYLFIVGHSVSAVLLLVWAIVLVSSIDNILRPLLIERGTQIHPLVILLSVLGGILFFGPIGFITGPLVMTLLSEFMNIYRQLVLHQGSEELS